MFETVPFRHEETPGKYLRFFEEFSYENVNLSKGNFGISELDYSNSIPFDEISISKKYVQSVTDSENLSKITTLIF